MINAYLYQTEFNTYTLSKGNGSRNCIEKIVDTSLLDSKHKEVKSMQEIIDSVGEDRAGIAYAFSSYYNNMHINKNTKIIDVEELSYTSYVPACCVPRPKLCNISLWYLGPHVLTTPLYLPH